MAEATEAAEKEETRASGRVARAWRSAAGKIMVSVFERVSGHASPQAGFNGRYRRQGAGASTCPGRYPGSQVGPPHLPVQCNAQWSLRQPVANRGNACLPLRGQHTLDRCAGWWRGSVVFPV